MSIPKQNQAGFSVIELLITLTLAVVIGIMFFTLFKTNMVQYLNIQKDSSTATALASQESRLANVIRGTTGIVSANGNDLALYSYFYPSDTYVSLLHYYVSNGQLLADMTRMTANPPTGTTVAGSTKTYVIVSNFYQPTGGSVFGYLDSSNSLLGTPVSDLNVVKTIQINLAAKTSAGNNQSMSVQVNLRNRKTNL